MNNMFPWHKCNQKYTVFDVKCENKRIYKYGDEQKIKRHALRYRPGLNMKEIERCNSGVRETTLWQKLEILTLDKYATPH